jgi:hypothetical protein
VTCLETVRPVVSIICLPVRDTFAHIIMVGSPSQADTTANCQVGRDVFEEQCGKSGG